MQMKVVFLDYMTLWPPVEYSNIFCYFIERPGVSYTTAAHAIKEHGCIQLL